MRRRASPVPVPISIFEYSSCAIPRRLPCGWFFIFALAFAGTFAPAAGPGLARIQVGVSGAGNVNPASGLFAVGSTVTFSATPAEGFVFCNWTDAAGAPLSFDADRPTLSYTIGGRAALKARFIRNPFYRFAGTVNGWLRSFEFTPETGIPLADSRGLFAISFTKTGSFSGRVIFDGEVWTEKGTMNGLGKARLRLARADGTTLRVEVTLDVNDPASPLDVAVIGGDFCALGSVAMRGAPVLSPRWSVVLSPEAKGGTDPFGNIGYASLLRDASGTYRGVGRLGDGIPISFGGRIVRDHFEGVAALPIYSRLHDGGLLSGLLDFQTDRDPEERIEGTLQRRTASVSPQIDSRPTAAENLVYVSPIGSDANSGSREAPLRKLQTALAKISGEGEIVMLAGDYEGEKLDLASAHKVTIRSEIGRRVRILLGEKVMGSAFTQHSSSVWKVAVTSTLPLQGTENRFWVFEMGTPEGAISAETRHPLQRARDFRLDHFRLWQVPSIEALGFSTGRYVLKNGFLYLRTSSGEPPAASQEFRIPSQDSADSFVFGATDQTDISLEGIEVYFGMNNVNFNGAGKYRVAGCKFFGAGNSGILAINARVGNEEECDYAANANDGSSPVNSATDALHVTVINAWSHDNGDEGHSIHQHCRGYYLGGLFENNANGGITPAIGADAIILGAYTRGNLGGILPTVEPVVHVLVSGWTSNRDFEAMEQWTGGLATVVDCTVKDSTRYAFSGIVAKARMHVFNTEITGGQGNTGGAGSPGTVFKSGRAEIRLAVADLSAENLDLTGSSHRPPRGRQRLNPFAHRAPNGHVEIEELDGQGLLVSVLSEDFTLDTANVISISGSNPQALRLFMNPLTGVFNGVYREKSDPSVRRALRGILLQEQRIGWGYSDRNGASDLVKISPF